MFQDEARFGRSQDPRACWAPPGIRPVVAAQFVREYIYAYAAVSPHDGTLDALVLPFVDAAAMSLFLAEVAQRHPDEFVLLVLDGAGWHRAQELVVPANMQLLPLPPYSPELNPTEHLWDEIREKWFANTVFASLDAVEDQLVEALVALDADPQRIAALTGFPWITAISVNAT
jgi:transposase